MGKIPGRRRLVSNDRSMDSAETNRP